MEILIIWITCSKPLKAAIKEYFKDIEEIVIFEDVLSSYSHTKFNKLFQYKSIMALFELFVAENKDEFLSNYKGAQRRRYNDGLRCIMSKFRKLHNDSYASARCAQGF